MIHTVQFDVSDLSLISFIPMSQTISVTKRSDTCYFSHAQTKCTCSGICACDCLHQIEKTGSTGLQQPTISKWSYRISNTICKMNKVVLQQIKMKSQTESQNL